MDSNIKTIYIELLDEGTYVLRPTEGRMLQEGVYEVLASSDYDPELESWKFLPGECVVCEWVDHHGESILLAVNSQPGTGQP